MEKQFIVAPFIDILGVLKLISCIKANVPSVLIAPETIINPMIMLRNELVISDMLPTEVIYNDVSKQK